VTFREAARKKILWMAFALGLAFLALFATGLHFQGEAVSRRGVAPLIRTETLNAMMMMGFYAIDLLAVVMAVLTSVDTLSGEIASGTIQAIVTKPITRRQVLLGKWLGFAIMLSLYLALMIGGVSLVGRMVRGASVHHLFRGAGLICLECLLLLSITFLFGTTFSTLTNGVLALGFHGLAFIGGWIEQIGTFTHSARAVNVGIAASILMPSESLWRRAAFEMQSPLVGALGVSPFSSVSVPSPAMLAYAGLYTLAALTIAVHRFGRRDL
jgi:ABC-2 type transport system permease protein